MTVTKYRMYGIKFRGYLYTVCIPTPFKLSLIFKKYQLEGSKEA